MNVIEEIARKSAVLPVELQREVLDFVEFVAHKSGKAVDGIEKSPNVSGGAARIRQTRIAVWMLKQARRS
ncbi:MAG: DUF433 domain-containing protein [Pyrinomonadaceae bacterium]|nr:DUF433 domain-containing protein [Pyrinomonadaceae bacterium]